MRRFFRWTLRLILIVVLSGYVLYEIWFYLNIGIRRVSHSPDQRYKVVVYSYPELISIGMGGSGGGGGYVALYDQNGKKLATAEVEGMISNLDSDDEIYWDKDKVHIKLLATWPLPPNEPNKSLPAD